MKLTIALLYCFLVAQADDMGVARKMSENKFAPMPGLPGCATLAVESGDPSKGASVILLKGTAGCTIPWHWHTPAEQVMIAAGSAKSGNEGLRG
jgi:quercetin dioxygenase-like cupin family protein